MTIDKLLEEAEIGMDSGEVILTISLSDIPLCSSLVKKASIAPQLAAEVRRLREREKVLIEALEAIIKAEGIQEDASGVKPRLASIARLALAFDKPPIA